MAEQQKDVSNNPPGEKQPPQGAGEPSPGIKDKEAETSNSYGHTRESGETPKK